MFGYQSQNFLQCQMMLDGVYHSHDGEPEFCNVRQPTTKQLQPDRQRILKTLIR